MDNSWAAPGVWCECVSDEETDNPVVMEAVRRFGWRMPEVGGRYQIYDVVEHHTQRGRIGLRLVGFSPYIVFDIVHFRPLLDKDIELFRDIASKTPAEETEDA